MVLSRLFSQMFPSIMYGSPNVFRPINENKASIWLLSTALFAIASSNNTANADEEFIVNFKKYCLNQIDTEFAETLDVIASDGYETEFDEEEPDSPLIDRVEHGSAVSKSGLDYLKYYRFEQPAGEYSGANMRAQCFYSTDREIDRVMVYDFIVAEANRLGIPKDTDNGGDNILKIESDTIVAHFCNHRKDQTCLEPGTYLSTGFQVDEKTSTLYAEVHVSKKN